MNIFASTVNLKPDKNLNYNALSLIHYMLVHCNCVLLYIKDSYSKIYKYCSRYKQKICVLKEQNGS